MTRFRKRPIEITAMQWTGGNETELNTFTGGRFRAVPRKERPGDLAITAEVHDDLHATWVGVKTGHWVIRGVSGEYYPIDEDVLAETYDRIEEFTP